MSDTSVVNEREGKGDEKVKKVTVVVAHNGVSREFKVSLTSTVQELLTRAMEEFGVRGQPNYALFTAANVELNVGQTLQSAGIVADQKLVLRPRVSGSGGARR